MRPIFLALALFALVPAVANAQQVPGWLTIGSPTPVIGTAWVDAEKALVKLNAPKGLELLRQAKATADVAQSNNLLRQIFGAETDDLYRDPAYEDLRIAVIRIMQSR